jgi:hypothetical protein
MIWLGWRQQRTETLIAGGILVAIVLLLLPTGLDMASTFHRNGLAACLGVQTNACQEATHEFTARFESTSSLVGWLTLVPGLIGVLLAAPFLLDLETGTYRLAWTQSITRRRWLAGKLGLAIAAALLAALAFTLILTWWRAPLVRIDGRLDSVAYDSEGTVVFGYVLFALGLAAAVGAVWRRAVPALMVAFVGYFASRLFVDIWLRQRLITPKSVTWSVQHGQAALSRAWVLTQYPSDRLGHHVAVSRFAFDPCAKFAAPSKVAAQACLAKHGEGFMHAVFQPASRFWALQGIETALFGGIGLVLIALSAWWVHQRAA